MLSNLSLNKAFILLKRSFLFNQKLNIKLVKSIKISLCCVSLLVSSLAYALAPVVDAYDDDDDVPPTATSSPSSSASQPNESSKPASNPNASFATNPSPVNSPTIPSNSASFSLEQRVTILERQIANLNPLLVQIDDFNNNYKTYKAKLNLNNM